jgi:hypothetical protein
MTDLLSQYAKETSRIRDQICVKLREKIPEISHLPQEALLKIYDTCYSLRQGSIGSKGNGGWWETTLETMFSESGMKRQVHINNDGIIVESGGQHIIDIVLGNPVIGEHISKYIVVSCKTSVKDRWTHDSWTFIHPPKLFVLASINSTYPTLNKFKEGANRKIFTLKPKRRDTRMYKLSIEGLVDEIKTLLS